MATIPGGPFDANNHEPAQSFEPLPPGDYKVMIVGSEVKMSKSGGEYLNCEFEVIEGMGKGRKVWEMFNFVNSNPKAVEIAQQQFSALCHACGVMNVTDSAELHNKPFVAYLKITPANGSYEPKNNIRGYKRIEGAQQAQAAPQPTQAPAAQPPAAQAAQATQPELASNDNVPWNN